MGAIGQDAVKTAPAMPVTVRLMATHYASVSRLTSRGLYCRGMRRTRSQYSHVRGRLERWMGNLGGKEYDIRLTLSVYTHVELEDQTAAIEALPAPPSVKGSRDDGGEVGLLG